MTILRLNTIRSVLNSRKLFSLTLFLFLSIHTIAAGQGHESWSYNLNIYEVNTRQYTPSGTFKAFETHLDRLKDLGVGIIWFMPIHPIGLKNRLGTLGSPYSVKDYLQVNPEFGTLDEFKALVDSIHAKGMYVIMDWVANHTAWDNALTQSHPEWYVTDAGGNFTPPTGTNWSDVIQLDYSQQGLRNYMINAMIYWIEEVDVDGFRCDAVSFMPRNFWSDAIDELKQIKPELLMLAEDDGVQYRSLGFDMAYAWGMYGFGHGVLKRIVDGTDNAADLYSYIKNEITTYSGEHDRLYFTSNHDENAWHGTVSELFGNAGEAYAVLTATVNDMQLIYNGQEAGLNKRLAFFDKDVIPWRDHPNTEIYQTLNKLKQENRALWNGSKGGLFQRVENTNSQCIFSFVREKEDDKIFAVFNLSPGYNGATLTDTLFYGTYVDVFSSDTVTFTQPTNIVLDGWDYHLYEQICTTTGINKKLAPVTDFRLDQNYPNPFNPVTQIGFRLNTTCKIEVSIFNLLGQKMTTLFDGKKAAGYHTIPFNAQGLPGGIYFYRIASDEFSATRKMIYVQ